MYAIVRTGGKQYRVEEGRTVTVERLPVEEGAAVELDNVLLIEDDGQVTVGSPIIEGARVLTEVEANGRAKKIIVFKYRAKVRTRKKTGHRQHFTRLAITEILRPGQESKTAKPKRRRRAKAVEKPAEALVAETPVDAAAAATAAAAPKRGTRRKAAATKTSTAAKAAPKTKARKPAAAKAKAETPTAKTAAPKRKTARKKKDGDAAGSPKATASAESTTAGEAEKKPARRRKATPPKAAGQERDNEE